MVDGGGGKNKREQGGNIGGWIWMDKGDEWKLYEEYGIQQH